MYLAGCLISLELLMHVGIFFFSVMQASLLFCFNLINSVDYRLIN